VAGAALPLAAGSPLDIVVVVVPLGLWAG